MASNSSGAGAGAGSSAEHVQALDQYYLSGGAADLSHASAPSAAAAAALAKDPSATEENCVYSVMVVQTEYGFPTFKYVLFCVCV
jgi:hypothetical protein